MFNLVIYVLFSSPCVKLIVTVGKSWKNHIFDRFLCPFSKAFVTEQLTFFFWCDINTLNPTSGN
jgi:hypothetical protein